MALALLAACQDKPLPGLRANLEKLPTLVTAEQPDVTIGIQKGKTPYLLSTVSDATRQSDGTVVVADCTSSEVRFFDGSGRFQRAVGGRGQGPGEFGWVRSLFPIAGDTIGVVEAIRVTILAPDGKVVRTIALTQAFGGIAPVLGRMASGSFVARRWDNVNSVVEVRGHLRRTASLLLLNDNGRLVDSLARLPEFDALPPANPGAQPITGLRLSRNAVFAVHSHGVYYGTQDEAGIVELDTAFTSIRTITTFIRPEPVTDEVREAYEVQVAVGAHDRPSGEYTQGRPRPRPYAPMMPAFGDLIAGRDGRLWVEDPVRPGSHPLVWTAHEDGEPLLRAEIPPRFFPFEFGRDWVLGVAFDELAVERVQLWRLVPGELSGETLPPRDAQPPTVNPRCGTWTSR